MHLVLGESLDSARAGAAAVRAEYRGLHAILTIRDAIAAESFHSGPLRIAHGDAAREIAHSRHSLAGELSIGGQEHFYLETQCALARLDTSGGIIVDSSTQHPSETQEVVARVLGITRNMVTVECVRMGGAFGGKAGAKVNSVTRRPSRRSAHGRRSGPCACACHAAST